MPCVFGRASLSGKVGSGYLTTLSEVSDVGPVAKKGIDVLVLSRASDVELTKKGGKTKLLMTAGQL